MKWLGLIRTIIEYCNLTAHVSPKKQITKDIRDVSVRDLDGVESIIHLAGLSNDPLGELAPQLTDLINHRGVGEAGKMRQGRRGKAFRLCIVSKYVRYFRH